MKAKEFNFDGLVGPTHSYAGLSYGNVASMSHRSVVANPKMAALQGLQKAKALADWGMGQGLFAPLERPDIASLRRVGFTGTDENVLATALKRSPEVLAACASASSMWVANSATISPSSDTADGKVHFTPANLNDKFHRSIEFPTTSKILRSMFPEGKHFAHHEALPPTPTFGDEGAANHTRLCGDFAKAGLEVFVYGRVGLDSTKPRPEKFPARQTLEASEAIVRLHQLDPNKVVYAQQSPAAIDAGAFHNDVVSVGNQDVFFFHQEAFVNKEKFLAEMKSGFRKVTGKELHFVEVPTRAVTFAEAVKTYLFNSQLVSLPNGEIRLIAPTECEESPTVQKFLKEEVFGKTRIDGANYFDLRQSMQNGGGPACLRLRVVLNETEQAAMNQGVLLNDKNYNQLTGWVEKHYRDRLTLDDLADPLLLRESRAALDQLTQILKLGSVYPFQL